MLARSKTRVISILLSLVMVISAMPIQAFAAEPEAHDHDHAVEPIVVEELETAAPEEESATDSEETPVDDEETTEVGDSTPAEGDDTTTEGDGAPAEGDDTTTEGDGAPTEGDDTTTEGDGAPAEGDDTTTEGDGVPAEGDDTTTEGDGAPTEGDDTTTEGDGAPAEGDDTTTEGDGAATEGDDTTTEGDGAPVEGEEIPEGTVPEEEIPEEILQEEQVQEIEISEAYQDIQGQIDDLLMAYLGSTELTRDEIEDIVVGEMDGGMILEAQWEIMCIEEEAMEALTEDELELLVDSNPVLCDFAELLDEYAEPISLYTDVSVLDGQITVSDTANSNTVSNGVVTIKASGSLISKKTNTVKIINNSGATAKLTFDYNASTYSSFTIADESVAASGTYSAVLDAGSSVTLVLISNSGLSNRTATLTLSNFSLTTAAASSNVTFEYDSALGSVTVGGAAVESGAVQEISLADGAALVATANSGAAFLGWVDETGQILSTATSYTLNPAADMTVKAVFASPTSAAIFQVGTKLFDDLNKAVAAGSKVILAANGTLPAGDYTVPSGVTLLIPFDSAGTCYTTEPVGQHDSYATPTAFRTLIMANGANITVNGGMSVSAKHYAANGGGRGSGSPSGAVGFVRMQDGSAITVNSGGGLYAWGYITGSGSVVAKSGAVVYENFQVEDFRGGTQTTDMSNGVFPLSQYYVQNIEVPLTLYSGAKEYSYTSLYMSSMTLGSSVAFISNSSAMFNLTSGYVTKEYDGTTDRLIVEAYGDLRVSPITMKIGSGLLSKSINSDEYELPINGNITVKVYNGSITLEQDVNLLPGAEIIIGENVTCTLGSGNSIYVYDAEQWGNYCGSTNKTFFPVSYAPGKTYTRTDADLVDAKIEIKAGGVMDASAGFIYTTAGGAAIIGNEGAKAKIVAGSETVAYQLVQGTGNSQIPITPAKLKNADGNYITSGTNTYTYTNGKWICGTHTDNDPEDYICDICGTAMSCDSHSADVPVSENVKAPTCTAAGSHDVVVYCSKCGEEMSRETVTDPATGHTEVEIPAVPATCTATGLTAGKRCSVCGTVTVEQETTDMVAHTEETIAAVAPTCTTTGLTEGKKCSVCGEITVAQTEVAAKGHSYTSAVTTAATCGKTGVRTYTCDNDKSHTYTEEIPATGAHTLDFENSIVVKPTCEEAGYEIVSCVDCDFEQTYAGDPALGHKETTIAGKAPTCTATGLTDGVKCSVCGETLTEQTEIPMIAHAYDDGVVTTTPTCGAAGVKTFTCGVCGDTYTEAIDATAHTEEVLPAVAPDCETTGLTEGKKCSVCNAILVAQEVVPALGHTEETVAGKAPTCTETGLTEGKKCSVCGKTLAEQETIDALGHSYTGEVTTAPGCETTGVKTFTCGVCGDSYTEEIAATDHDWDEGEVTTAPGCETTGVKTYTCQNDNSHTYTEEIAETGHDWDEGVVTKEASCGVKGEKTYTCGNCGGTYTEDINPLGHAYKQVVVEATCETDGSSSMVCANCGNVHSVKVIPALGHSYDEGVVTTAPTCTEAGEKTCTCGTCGDTKTETIAAVGHTEEEIPAVDATCEESGLTAGVKCSVCGETLTAQTVVPALGHAEETVAGKDATCTEDGLTDGVKCSVCGQIVTAQEVIPALGHTEETVAGKDATCTESGLTDGVKCSVCGAEITAQTEIPALGHSWDNGEVTTTPGCESAGMKTYTCSACGETKTEAVSATGHTEETVPAVDATCAATGLTEGVKCSVCGAVIKAQEEIPALGHSWDNGVETTAPGCETAGVKTYTCSVCGDTKTEEIAAKGHTEETVPAVEATCEDTGLTAGVKCSVCGETLTAQEVVPAKGHAEETVAGKDATCTESGLTAGVKCSVCGETLTAQEVIPALGHTEETIAGKAATCEETGLTDGVKCSVCGETLTAQEVIPALGHTEETIAGKAATCTEPGLTDGVKCSVCGETLTAQEVIPALGHTEETIAGKAATCTEPGLTDGVKCSVCSEVLTEQAEIPVIPHAYDDGVVTIDPDCTNAGVKTFTCSACGDTYTEAVAAIGHNYDAVVTAPTCTEKGYTTHTCSACGHSYKDSEIAATGHTEAGAVVENRVEPGCTTEGSYETVVYCSVCDAEMSRVKTVLDAVGHIDEVGGDNKCDNCGTDMCSEGHSYDAGVVTAPTCEEQGYTTYTCERCGENYKDEYVDALGHSWDNGAVTKESTCTESGVKTYTCSACGDIKTESVDALGHTEVEIPAVEATCEEPGLTAGVKCSVCGETLTAQEPVDALGHSYDNGVETTAPTCTEAGIKTYTCSACGDTKTESVDALGHTEEEIPAVEATCGEPGLTAGVKCSVCGETLTAQEPVDALGHSYDDGVETKAPTCTETGVKTYTCSACGDTKTESVDALGHTEEEIPAVEATCEEPGLTAGVKCSVCGETLTAQEPVDALGHSYDDGVETKAPTCTEAGVKTYTCSACGDTKTESVDALGHTEEEIPAVEATCEEPGLTAGVKCSVCGETLTAQEPVDALGHSYDDGVETKAPTCTEAGVKTYTCSACGDTKTESVDALGHSEEEIPAVEATCEEPGLTAGVKCSVCGETLTAQELVDALGHSYDNGVETKAPTCTEAGVKTYTCSTCGDTKTESVDALGHSEEEIPAVEATCEGPGLTAGVKCSVCGETLTAQEPVDALGHSYDDGVETKAPTCTDAGEITYSCSACGNTKIEVVPAVEHSYEDEVVAPTCKDRGYTKHTCSVCGNTYTDNWTNTVVCNLVAVLHEATCTTGGYYSYVCSMCGDSFDDPPFSDPLGHTEETIPGKDATCTEDGLSAGVKCSVCGEILTAQEVITAPGHTEETIPAVDATCEETGLSAGVKCSVCGEILSAPETVPALGHTEEEIPAVDPTCEDTGLGAGVKCSVCGKVLTEQEEIAALGHAYVGEVTTEADCESAGVKTFTCSTCGDSYTEEIAAIGHAWNEGTVSKEATCTETGEKTFVCQNDGSHTKVEEIPVEAHTDSDGNNRCDDCGQSLCDEHQYESVVTNPTCQQGGYTTHTCSACGESYKDNETPAADHLYTVYTSDNNATCEENGTQSALCDYGCGTKKTVELENSALKHDYISTTVQATCETEGYTIRTCSRCGDERKYKTADATGHNYDGGVVTTEPGCETTGIKTFTCKNDKSHTYTEVVEATGHTPAEAIRENIQDGNCTAGSSYDSVVYCSACEKELSRKTVTIEATDHTPAEMVVENKVDADCETAGSYDNVVYCSVCGDEISRETVTVDALGHTAGETVVENKVDADCETAGSYDNVVYCSVCDGEISRETVTVDALGHKWNWGVITTEATCEAEGIKLFTCTVCDGTKEEPVEALGHDLVEHEGKKPTYTDAGWDAYVTCTRCDYTTYVEIPALGEATITSFEEFVENLAILEELTDIYVKKVSPGKDPAGLIIKYIRTGVDRYNSGSWNIMAGYEDADFAKFITEYENDYNANLSEGQELLAVTGLKNIDPFYLPNGDFADIGHVFGTMDITYTNKSSVNHADVAGWGGDLVDLLSLSDQFGVEATELEALVAEVTEKYFLRFEEEFPEKPNEGTFSLTDVYGDLDGFHIMQELYAQEYENGVLTELFTGYLTEDLTANDRAEYFLANRLGGVSLRGDVRDAVYNTYLGNSVIATLEGTREFKAENLNDLRKAVCYAFADYICKLGGDYVQSTENPYLTVFQSTTSTLAPGITQKINYATTADDQTMVYYIATGDITRDDVHVYANYNNNDPGAGWAMQRVLDQANAAQAKYGDPASEQYIENYNVIVSTNGDGYNMHTGEPGGLLVMDGYEWHPCDGSGFFAILADGTARIGTLADYKELKAQGLVKEAIGAFGTTLVSEGKINVTATGNYFADRASRTAVGITATGKVVMLVIDGRQGEFSCGASAIEIAQIMLDAGCYTAVNLDGGGSSTYVARPEGEDALRVVSSPSDGAARSVSTSLLMVSTAPSSTAFDHAVLNSDHTYLAAGATTQVTAKAVSATGNVVDMPEGTTWAVSDETLGAIDESGVFTASANGQVDVNLMLGEEIIGSKTLYVVTPDNVYFDKDNINAIYGHVVELPVKAVYEGKNVAITESDVVLSLGNPTAGIIDGFTFTGIEESGLKKVTVNAALAADTSVTASMLITLYSEDEASFDFDNATGGDRQLAWDREVSNSTQQSADVYRVVEPAEPMSTTYTFAIDMSKIEIPDKLADLTYMLPGADMENASAWNFLLQLAERVSVLTEVRPVLRFDPNFELDYSEMTVANEYFLLSEDGVEFDEENNALTLVLKWKDQENPIDADTANPLCILSGIKLTPKEDAQWDAKNQLKAVNTGEISYEIYLRANALYSFAQKPENQEIYGLKPFENKDFLIGGSTEKGASFGDIYKTFEDSYTLVNAVKDGWVIEDGGFAYYKDGERLTGICEVDGLYYDFGDDGINAGQTPYTGVMVDEEGNEYYLVNGTKYCGWWTVDQKDIRYYNEETGIRESLIADETPSTCIIDGHCIYTTESGLVKRIDYDDAGGHDYVEQADGSYVCALCGYVRIEMPDVDVTLSYYECTYTGTARTPSTTAVAKDGRVLTKPGQSDYPDYSSTYKDNVEVGTASVTLKAARYGKYSNLQTWRGNAAGEITVTYEIRPDVPANVEMTANGDAAVMTWDAAKAPGVTYVIYRTADGSEWEEFATTEETTYSVDLADCDGCMFRIGTRKIVDGKAYESLTFTKNVSAGIVVMADNNEEGKPTLKWSAVSGAESYQVYRATRQNGTYSQVFTTAGNSYTHASAAEGTTYYYKVKAVLSDGTTVTSEIVTATCKAPEVEIEITTGNNAEGKPTLKWTAVDGAASYQVYRATKENGTYSKVFTTTGTTYTHASAEVGSTYYYKLKVVLESGTEVFTDVVTNTCLAPEEEIVIELVTGHNADGKPTLKWNAIEGAESYAVYRSTTEGGTYAKVFTTAGTTYTHVSATAGKSYFYKLKVTMDDGSEIYSDVVTNTCVIPEAKFVITTGNNAEGKPTLKWNVIEGAASYEVHRSTTENGTYQKVFATTGTTYTHVSATAGRSYYYKLKVILNDGSEEFSQIVTNTCLIPDAMFNITAGHNADGKPTLKWTAIAGAESYDVYRSVEEDGLYQKVFTTAGTTYTHVSATPGNTYYYKLKVTLADGTEETSDIIVNSCLNLNYDFIITTGNNASGKPTMAWEPIVDAKSYEVYRSNTKNGTYNQVFTTTGTTYTHVSAVEGNTYYYKLKVIFNDGSAKTSDIVTNSCLGA